LKRETIRYMIHRKTGKKVEKSGKNTKKQEKKNRKLLEIQKRDFDEVLGNAENGNEFEVFSNVILYSKGHYLTKVFRRTDRPTDGRTDRRTDGRTD
jgi:hypothetical protein